MKENSQQKNIVHVSFEIGLLLKALHGFAEILGGILLLFLSPDRLSWLTRVLTQQELSEDPTDFLANSLLRLSSNFSISTQYFAVFYLMSHGIVASVLVLFLWRRKLWAYPLVIAVLILFIAYQGYRYNFTHSIFLIALTVFDLIMILLTYLEYKRIQKSPKTE